MICISVSSEMARDESVVTMSMADLSCSSMSTGVVQLLETLQAVLGLGQQLLALDELAVYELGGARRAGLLELARGLVEQLNHAVGHVGRALRHHGPPQCHEEQPVVLQRESQVSNAARRWPLRCASPCNALIRSNS
jgi:hypothetical protein